MLKNYGLTPEAVDKLPVKFLELLHEYEAFKAEKEVMTNASH